MDRKHWGDPEVFRPERFLNEHGGIVQDDWFVPFGFGKLCNRPACADGT
jgi:methyl farnesoate epoxidase/farnesoate epoxidase